PPDEDVETEMRNARPGALHSPRWMRRGRCMIRKRPAVGKVKSMDSIGLRRRHILPGRVDPLLRCTTTSASQALEGQHANAPPGPREAKRHGADSKESGRKRQRPHTRAQGE